MGPLDPLPPRATRGLLNVPPRLSGSRPRESRSSSDSTSRFTSPRCLSSVSLPPFEDIVAEHGSTVFRVCRAVLGPVDAEDAWSETFLAALKAYPRLRPESNVKGWLVTIAHRKALNEKRSESRRPVTLEELPDRPTTLGIPGGAETELLAALQALPVKQRQAVAYHHLAGLPYAEIAAILGGTTDAARRAAADGIARLRKSVRTGELEP